MECDAVFVTNFIMFVLSRFRNNLLAANHIIICNRIKYDTEEKSSKLVLDIMTLMLLVNNVEFVLRGRPFILYYEIQRS